jgi:hypothetical protein
MKYSTYVAFIAMLFFADCKSKEEAVSYTAEPAIIYSTKADYSNNVPVTLSADKMEIVAYPSPKDVFYKGALAKPVSLQDGFWLDNRGIGPNSAFLKMTYEEYSKLSAAPVLADLMKMIIDKDPFVSIYNLGNRDRFKDEAKEINALIAKGALKKFKQIK